MSVTLWDEIAHRGVCGTAGEDARGGASPAGVELRCPDRAEGRQLWHGAAVTCLDVSSQNSLPGGAAMRNATAAGQDFRVVAIPVLRCGVCGNYCAMMGDCPQCGAYARHGLRVRKCLGCMRATPLPAHRFRCDDCGGREVA